MKHSFFLKLVIYSLFTAALLFSLAKSAETEAEDGTVTSDNASTKKDMDTASSGTVDTPPPNKGGMAETFFSYAPPLITLLVVPLVSVIITYFKGYKIFPWGYDKLSIYVCGMMPILSDFVTEYVGKYLVKPFPNGSVVPSWNLGLDLRQFETRLVLSIASYLPCPRLAFLFLISNMLSYMFLQLAPRIVRIVFSALYFLLLVGSYSLRAHTWFTTDALQRVGQCIDRVPSSDKLAMFIFSEGTFDDKNALKNFEESILCKRPRSTI